MQNLYENIFYDKQVNELFTDESLIKYMLRFEAALTVAQAQQGMTPASVAKTIEECCIIDNIKIEQLVEDAALGGNINIPLIQQLTEAVKKKNAEAAKYVHYGATSQDVIDTALILQLRDALKLIDENLQHLISQLVILIEKHRYTLMIGRTFMQHATPITFGFKIAGWLDGMLRSKKRIEKLLVENFVLQAGGAVGTLSTMQGKGLPVAETMAEILQLKMPSIPWHTQRDRLAEIAATLGIVTGSTGKIAKDISLLMQTEIAEVFEPSAKGKGGSSTMPHKRNPVGCVAILANAARVPALVSVMLSTMIQDHERAAGNWHAEWETLADIVRLTAGAVHQAVIITNGLEINKEQMLHNLEQTKGLIYAENISIALAKHIGKADAHNLMEQICKDAQNRKMHVKDLISGNTIINRYLSQDEIENLFSTQHSTGLCDEFINRVLSVSGF